MRFPALCFVAIAYYRDENSCRRFKPFVNVFKDLDGKWVVVDSSESLQHCFKLNHEYRWGKTVLLRNGQYYLTDFQIITNATLAALEKNSDVTITGDRPFSILRAFARTSPS